MANQFVGVPVNLRTLIFAQEMKIQRLIASFVTTMDATPKFIQRLGDFAATLVQAVTVNLQKII